MSPTMQQTLTETRPTIQGPQVLTFALLKRPRATRASVRKVRTGCITCKKRHVKCDETKPACQRCIKLRGQCEGYQATEEQPLSVSAAATEESRPINGRTRRNLVPKLEKDDTAPAVRLLKEPEEHIFNDDLERQYLLGWCLDQAHRGRASIFEDVLWTQTIPQLGRQSSSIRYAMMATSALNKAVAKCQALKRLHMAQEPEYAHALMYYGRALRSVQGETRGHSLRAVVVCCLLFVCFELIQGNQNTAFVHLDNGQVIMNEILERSDETCCNGNPLGEESLEQETLQIFQRLIYQSWSCGVLRPLHIGDKSRRQDVGQTARAWCCRGGFKSAYAVDKMPEAFGDLTVARQWWDATQHHITHSSDLVFPITYLGVNESNLAECNGRMQNHLDKIQMMMVGCTLEPDSLLHQLQADLERWYTRFEPLWVDSQASRGKDEKTYFRSVSLRIQYLHLYTCVQAPLSCDYERICGLTPAFREIVELSDRLLSHAATPSHGGLFTMDVSPTYPLFLAGMRCRDFGVRERAIKLLSMYPRRDGLWDSRIFCALAVKNRSLEIQNAREGSAVDQWWRLQTRKAWVDHKGNLKVKALARNPVSGKWEHGEEHIDCFPVAC